MVTFVAIQTIQHFAFPNHHELDSTYGYRKGEVAFPGQRVHISLAQKTLEGAYKVEHATVTIDGRLASEVKNEGLGRGISDNSKAIYYKGTPSLDNDVGLVSFLLPATDDIFNKDVTVKYDVDFYYPEVTAGTQSFTWQLKRLEGEVIIRVGTKKDYWCASLMHGAQWYVPIVVGLVTSVLFLFLMLRHPSLLNTWSTARKK